MKGVFYGSVSRRSSITWRIKTTGETGHSSAFSLTEKAMEQSMS